MFYLLKQINTIQTTAALQESNSAPPVIYEQENRLKCSYTDEFYIFDLELLYQTIYLRYS